VAEWKHAGLATLRKVVRVEFGAKFVCSGNVSLGYVRLVVRDWEGAASFF